MPSQAGMTSRVDADGIAHVVFDTPDSRVNLLDAEILHELERLLELLRSREDVRALLFSSAKPGMFLAGMDVARIAAVTDAYRAAEGARAGQGVFQKIAELGRPTACAIGGTCLGGGTELALACDLRIAADDPAVRIGLPEVQLGIIPGFGGTQRLPRLVGLPAALELILTGRGVDGGRARSLGLVDLVVPAAYLEREARVLLLRVVREGAASVVAPLRRRAGRMLLPLLRLGPARRFVVDRVRRRTASRVPPRDYPAPFRAIEAVEAAVTRPLGEGLDLEARIVGELVPTPTSKNLIWLFRSRSALKGDAAQLGAAPRRVDRIGVIGAGIMGGGIAQLAADRGIPVRLKDLRYEAILAALRAARGTWDRRLLGGRIDAREVEQRMAFIAPTLDDTGLIHADLVIEAVVEDLDTKRKVLSDVEQRIGERAVFASNTSCLPIAEIAAQALRPERVVGLHFFNPVDRMQLVEVVAGRLSSPEAVATAHAFAVRLGKVPVLVRDGPGFLVNRVLTPYLNEAMRLLGEGARIEAIDAAMTAFGMPVGPFALLDQVGLDTAHHVAGVLAQAFGERIGAESTALEKLVAAGRTGRKGGSGFYRYRSDRRLAADPEVYRAIGSPAEREIPAETMQERMVLAMVHEAVLCLEQGVVRQPRDVDMAMVLGTGFPPFRGGLLRHADAVGVPIVADRLSRLADAHGERFRPAETLQRMVRGQRRFYEPEASRPAVAPGP